MKSMFAGAANLNHRLSLLRNERWPYLAALGSAAVLSALLIISTATHLYAITNLFIQSNKEIKKINGLHTSVKIDTTETPASTLMDWQIFGAPPVVSNSLANSNFTLLGIQYVDKNAKQATAIISTDDGNDNLYHVGDKLPQGAILQRIEPNYIELLYNGVLQKLSLDWKYDSSDINSAADTNKETLNKLAPVIDKQNIPRE